MAGAGEDGLKHGGGEFSGSGVLVGGMVGGEEGDSVGHGVFGGVGEGVGGLAGDHMLAVQEVEVGVKGDFTESDDDFQTLEGSALASGEFGAGGEFLGQGLVVGWGTADGGGDPHVAELESVIACGGGWQRRESEAVEDGIHEVAGGVSGEGTAGSVAAVCSGGEAKDEDAGGRVSEAGNGTGPVVTAEVGAALLASDALAVLDKTGAAAAGDDFGFEDGEGRRGVHGSRLHRLRRLGKLQRLRRLHKLRRLRRLHKLRRLRSKAKAKAKGRATTTNPHLPTTADMGHQKRNHIC